MFQQPYRGGATLIQAVKVCNGEYSPFITVEQSFQKISSESVDFYYLSAKRRNVVAVTTVKDASENQHSSGTRR